MDASLIRQVRHRADDLCEYCQLAQEWDDRTFEIDHVVSKKHQGRTTLGNLALSCFRCNSFKGTDNAARDSKTRKLSVLFHPRRHKWDWHFRWNGPWLEGRTAIGRVTIVLLQINHPFRVALRVALIEEGVFPAI